MSGPAPLPKRISMRIWFITIGIGFGIMERRHWKPRSSSDGYCPLDDTGCSLAQEYSVSVDVLATKTTKLPILSWPSTMENPFSFLAVRGLSGKSNMGVSNHVYFDSNAKQENTKSHGLKGIKDPLADRGKFDIFENFIQAVRNRKKNI